MILARAQLKTAADAALDEELQAPRLVEGLRPRGKRRSLTEDIYKIYGESFRGGESLRRIVAEAQEIVRAAIAAV
jgi:hypothetical protein